MWGSIGIQDIERRDAAKHLSAQESFPPQTIIQLNMPIVLKLRNPRLEVSKLVMDPGQMQVYKALSLKLLLNDAHWHEGIRAYTHIRTHISVFITLKGMKLFIYMNMNIYTYIYTGTIHLYICLCIYLNM